MDENTEYPPPGSPAHGADRSEILSPEPSEEGQDGPSRDRAAPRVMIAGVGYVPGRLAGWFLGRGGKPGDLDGASPSEEGWDRRVALVFALAALASFIAAVLDWRAGDHRGAVIALLVAAGLAGMAGVQRRPAMVWAALVSILLAGALVVYGFLT